jgi:cytochrome o ubiquinol oxidase subunit 2
MSKLIIFFLITVDVAVILFLLVNGRDVQILNPAGTIAKSQRDLLYAALILSAIIVVPTYILTYLFAWKYREGGKAKYDPEAGRNKILPVLWWVLPLIVILVLAFITYRSTHLLDPYRPIQNGMKPLTIQVVALRWKWLFIYPEQNIATVNYIQFPVDTPINFQLTADAPMNSFWIPKLSGQIYAMTGMSTKLHVVAEEEGEYQGSSAEISGRGFSGMRFIAKASSYEDFNYWVQSIKRASKTLTFEDYEMLAVPSANTPQVFYSSAEEDLYNKIMEKFMPEDQNTKIMSH